MSIKVTEEKKRFLLALKLDSHRVFERASKRKVEYLLDLNLKRTRAHFSTVFEHRYKQVSINDLRECSEELMIALDRFYSKMDDLYWYLNHTEEMPTVVEDHVNHDIKELKEYYQTLGLYLDGELLDDGPSE